MKTKIKLLLITGIGLLTILGSSLASANFGASNESTNCDGQNCQTWHNTGISHGQYPNGTNFASFNNYRDAVTDGQNGRPFQEMQFMYVEGSLSNYEGFPLPTPWDNSSNYNFSQGLSHNLTFGNSDQPQRIGAWIYMHNTGVKNKYPARNTKVRVDRWASATPQTSYNPRTLISSSNTKPRNVWSDIQITADRPFTLNPVELYGSREDGDSTLPSQYIQSLTHDGMFVRSNGSNDDGEFDSSSVHYVLLYLEFEATPSEQPPPRFCKSLEIIQPTAANDGLPNRFVNPPVVTITEPLESELLQLALVSDPGLVNGYRYYSVPNGAGITFKNNAGNQTGVSDLSTANNPVYMDGFPVGTPAGAEQTIWVQAISDLSDPEHSWELPCVDTVKFVYQPEDTEEPECADFNTIPTPPGTDAAPVPLDEYVTLDIQTLIDTEGNAYLNQGATPYIRYCYNNQNIAFFSAGNNHITQDMPNGDRCATASADSTVSFIASQIGLLHMEVVGAEQVCKDDLKTKEEELGGVCLDLDFIDDEFVPEDNKYCVDLNVESTVQGYNNNIHWEILRPGESNPELEVDTVNTTCIYLDDYPQYDFLPGDIITSQATDIDEAENCVDRLASDDIECERFRLNKEFFERGRNNRICVESTNWPVQSTGVEVSINGDSSFNLDVDENDCFIIDEDDLDDANEVEVWVPGWKDECIDELTRDIPPPDFNKNVKSSDAISFDSSAIANFSDDYVEYKINYEHKSDSPQDVTITDTIGRDQYIQGYIAAPDAVINSNTPRGGTIERPSGDLEDLMKVWVEGEGEIDDCGTLSSIDDELCYYGDIYSPGGVTIKNMPERTGLVVSYIGEITNSTVTPENCSDPNHPLYQSGICGEVYNNRAEFDDDTGFSGIDFAEVIIPCPFLIIRSGGEVFLENPFDYGIDTLSCSEIQNVPVPIVVPDNPPTKTPSTGEGETLIQEFSDRLCQDGTAPGYEDIERISSLICEITLKTSDDLTQYSIAQNINRNILLFARYNRALNNLSSVNGSVSLPEATGNVYVKDNGDLSLGGEFSDKARTIVVIGHDVYINQNITFKDPLSLSDPRQVPSLALIVIGGDLIISPAVTETNGVFFVQEDKDGKGGEMCEKDCSDEAPEERYNSAQYVHYGSIYGDIQHLFKYRTFAGDPTKQESAILIRFDNRVYLNTPPLLNELVNIAQDVL